MSMLTGDYVFGTSCSDHRADVETTPASDAATSDDAKLYLRHVEEGCTIRALAREAGCHASTILRRIRRFEGRRDDPLVDAALAKVTPSADADQRQTLRILRRLAEPRAIMATAEGMEKAIVSRDNIRTAVLERRLAEPMALQGWVVQVPGGGARPALCHLTAWSRCAAPNAAVSTTARRGSGDERFHRCHARRGGDRHPRSWHGRSICGL